MFQIKTRVNSLNFNLEDQQSVNLKIQEIQEKFNVEFPNIKELFNWLLELALSKDKVVEVVENPVDISEFQQEISILNERILSLEAENKDLFEKQLLHSESEINVLKIPCSEEQVEVLKGIAENRLKKGYEDALITPDEVIKKIAFREPYLYNHWGDFFTGL